MTVRPPPAVGVDTLFAHGAAVADDALVSVIVSLHNDARFLPACLDSVAAQTHAVLDLVIVDDAADGADVAAAWLAAHAGRFVRATLLRHARNQGVAATRNTGFAHACGDFAFVLDADNMLYPRAIARLHEVARAERFDAAYTQLECFGAEPRLGDADVWRKDNFRHGNFVDAMALVSRRAWRMVGGYTPIEGGGEDYDFWCKFIDHGLTAAYVPEILCRYRVHDRGVPHTGHRDRRQSLAVQLTLRHPWLRVQ